MQPFLFILTDDAKELSTGLTLKEEEKKQHLISAAKQPACYLLITSSFSCRVSLQSPD